jgi:hypothetical protein
MCDAIEDPDSKSGFVQRHKLGKGTSPRCKIRGWGLVLPIGIACFVFFVGFLKDAQAKITIGRTEGPLSRVLL